MEYKPSPDTTSLKDLRIARSLSQDDVAEAIGTNANTISRWERGVATPSLYYRRKLAELFEIDPQELFSDLNDEGRSTMDYVNKDCVNIDIRVIPDPQEENAYLVTASTTGRNKKTVPGRFSFSAEAWLSVEPSLIALEAIDRTTRDQAQVKYHAQQVRDFGKYLFNCLINGEVRSLYDHKKQDAIRNSMILRLRLIFVPLDLVVLPWEVLYDERDSEYLCLTLQPKTVLIRSVDGVTHKKDNSLNYEPPLRILGVIADPRDLSPLRSEKEIIEEALQQLIRDEEVDLEWKPGRIAEIDDLPYSTDRWDVFHFTGHGRFDETSRQGQLAFEDERRRAKYISTQRFYASLHPATKLVVLDAFETARRDRFDRLSSIAHSLATQKIPAVVAMQFQVLDTASSRFSKIFYMLLARGAAIDEAVAEARREIYKTAEDPDSLDWAAPILYVSSSNIISFKTDLQGKPQQHERLEQERRELEERERLVQEEREREEWVRLEREKSEREEQEQLMQEKRILIERPSVMSPPGSGALSTTSNNAAAYCEMGNALFADKRYQEALEAYEQAIRLDPNYVDAYNGKGDVLHKLQRYQQAQRAYQRATRLSIRPLGRW